MSITTEQSPKRVKKIWADFSKSNKNNVRTDIVLRGDVESGDTFLGSLETVL